MSIPAKFHACITKCTILLKKWINLPGYGWLHLIKVFVAFLYSLSILKIVVSYLPVLIFSAICIETYRKAFVQILLNSFEP